MHKTREKCTYNTWKNIENIEDYYDALANISSGDIVLVGVTTVNQSRNFSQTYSRYIAIKVD